MQTSERERWRRLATAWDGRRGAPSARTTLVLPPDQTILTTLRSGTGGRPSQSLDDWLGKLPLVEAPKEPELPLTESEAETAKAETVPVEVVVAARPPFDPLQASRDFLRFLPYAGAGASVFLAPVAESPPPDLSTFLFLSSLPWGGRPSDSPGLGAMMERATRDAVARSRQSPLPNSSAGRFLANLPWSQGGSSQ